MTAIPSPIFSQRRSGKKLPLAVQLFPVNTGSSVQTSLVASDFLFHPYDVLQLSGSTITGERPPSQWRGSWHIADVQALSLLTFHARLNRSLTEAAGSDFDGTVEDLAAELGIDLDED